MDCKSLELEVITPQFFELTPNGPKQISFYAKKARGAMARYVVENRIDKAEDLIDFDLAGYSFQKMDHLGFHRHSSEKTVSFLMRDKYFKDAYKAVD